LKKLWIHTVRGYIKLGLFFYFKKIEVLNSDIISKNQPVLILGNHQNALLDALLIATTTKRFSYFLTRAGVFKNPLISKTLKSLNMIPVYRIRDGWNNLTNNNAVFKSCADLLNKNEAIAIFPEGNHNLQRKVRPLSKGFTRIVFDALDKNPELDLQLVPVGLNYEKPEFFGDSVSIVYGNLIEAKQFNSNNRNESIIKLKSTIFNDLTKLTTHIPSDNYDKTLKKLEKGNVDFLKPDSVNQCISTNFENCNSVNKNRFSTVKLFFKTLLILMLFVPYIIWKFAIQPKVKEKEFMATFRFAIAITLVPAFILIVMLVLGNVFSFTIAFLYLFMVLLLELSAVKL